MSSKSTILLSNANEHWYHDCLDDTFNLEIDPEHDCEGDEDGIFITIKKGTALHAAIEELWRKKALAGSMQPKSPWIPVSKPPEVGKDVVVTNGESIDTGFISSVSPFIDFWFKPTHWMYKKDFQFPLPE